MSVWLPEGWRPAPPRMLFGLWVLDKNGGRWLEHSESGRSGSPMTFESWDDAVRAAQSDRYLFEAIVVAVIGVAPVDEDETAALAALIH